MKNVISFSLAVAMICGSAALAESIGVLEAAGLGESERSELYDNLSAAGFIFQRPLVGRLAGQGSVWSIPAGMPLTDAAAIAGSLDGVVGTEDLNVCAEPSECSPVSYALPGQVRVIISHAPATPEREAVRDVLRSRGLMFVSEDYPNRSAWYDYYGEVWQCFPREYTLEEEVAASTVPGVVTVQLLGRAPKAMADGVQYAGILEIPSLDPARRAVLHSHLAELGFIYARPLKGRLQGQGYAWIVPSVPWASAAVKGMSEVVGIVNLHFCAVPAECLPGFRYTTGSLAYVRLNNEPGQDKWQTYRLLQEKGFMMRYDDQSLSPNYGSIHDMEGWLYLKGEFSVSEAQDEFRSTPGISWGSVDMRMDWPQPFGPDLEANLRKIRSCLGKSIFSCPECDVNGDWRINILDLIVLRNHMQDPPFPFLGK
ncbi:MAG TPA: hypothetical protein VM163_13120 [bacterium]|nr:hypothetical protein [bacterium]